jgi:hypothetical protein
MNQNPLTPIPLPQWGRGCQERVRIPSVHGPNARSQTVEAFHEPRVGQAVLCAPGLNHSLSTTDGAKTRYPRPSVLSPGRWPQS